MATKLFNFTNQRLSADKLREIQSFNSCDFGGIISKDLIPPFTVSGTSITLNASLSSPISILGGGLLFNQVSNETCSLDVSNKLWYMEVELDSSLSNITTDELVDISQEPQISKINFKSIICNYLNVDATYTYYTPVFQAQGNPNTNQYYEYDNGTYALSEDSEVTPSKTYYLKIEASRLTFSSSSLSASVFSYFGNTLWTSNTTFIIPLFANVDGNLVQTVIIRDLSDFEGLISMEAYAKLQAYANGTFVWSVGGREPVVAPDGSTHRKGDIGSLNITGDTIYNKTNYGTDINPDYHDPVKIENLTINNIANVNNDQYTKLIVSSDGNISSSLDYVEPVWHGGTGANTRGQAKKNLGIFYGTKTPQEQAPTPSPQEGDIYLWIIE